MASLAGLMGDGTLGRRKVQEIAPRLFREGLDPARAAADLGLSQISDEGELAALAGQVVASFPAETAKFRAGQEKVLSFLVGKLMKLSAGRADPRKAGELLRKAAAAAAEGGA
jgi:aspartyl-tRNA(Asn)/glutamyl-tRNA(Gln) amidotransferase subunit B